MAITANTGAARHARYIGRVGALAVALGVGAAMAGSPGSAWATPDTTGPVGSPAEKPGADATKVDTPAPNAATTPDPAPVPASKPKDDTTPDPTNPTDPEPNPPSQSSATINQGSSPAVTISGSGGLNTTVGTDTVVPDDPPVPTPHRLPVNKNDNSPQPVDRTKAPADPVTAIASAVVNITKTVIGFAAPATTASPKPAPTPSASARSLAPTIDTAARSTTLAPDPAPEPAGIVTTVTQLVATVLSPFLNPSPDSPAAPVFALTVLAWVRREIDTTTNKLATPPTDETLTSQAVAPMALARAAAPTTLAAAAPPPPPPTGLLPAVAAVVTGVGNTVGGIIGFLGGIIGGVFNQPPTANPQFTNIDYGSGVVTGKLNATDPNSDAMTYQVTTQATKGTVTVDAAGTFTYTPTNIARENAALTPGPDVDAVTITITDARGAKTTVAINNIRVAPIQAVVLRHISTHDTGLWGAGVTPNGTRLYVSNYNTNSVSVINTANDTEVASIPVLRPTHLAISPDGSRAYVNSFGRVVVIDTATNTEITTIQLEGSLFAQGIVVSPTGSRAYVASRSAFGPGPGAISVIDTTSNTVIATVATPDGTDTRAVAITPDGTRVYVANGPSGTVSVMDTASNTIVKTITVGFGYPYQIAISPDGKRAYITNQYTVSVVDTSTNEITASIPMYANAIAISPDGTRAYVGGGTEQQGGFSVVDLATNTVITTVPIEGGPVFVYVNRAGNLAYVTTSSHNPGGEGVTVLRLATV